MVGIGLVDGGEHIRQMDWKSVRGWLAVVRCFLWCVCYVKHGNSKANHAHGIGRYNYWHGSLHALQDA